MERRSFPVMRSPSRQVVWTGEPLPGRSEIPVTNWNLPTDIIPPVTVAHARLRRSTRRLSDQFRRIAASIDDIRTAYAHIRLLLEDQHRHFADLIARNDDVEHFCRRCNEIMEGHDPEQMSRERDWLIAGFYKRNAHRPSWLNRLRLRGDRASDEKPPMNS